MKDDREYIRIGAVSGPHGLNGFVKVAVITDVDSRFSEGKRVFILNKNKYSEYTIQSFEIHKGRMAIAQFSGVDSREMAEELSGCEIYIPFEEIETARNELGEGEFFFLDLVGLDVYKDNVLFGKVKSVVEAGSGHILQIESAGDDGYYVPFVDEMVDTSRIKDGRIDITPVEGLLEK